MDTKKNREKIIKEFLGLEELSPMEAGEIRGGAGKKRERVKEPNDPLDWEVDV